MNTWIGHIRNGKALFGVINTQWRRVIQGSKCGSFDNHPKGGVKTALHQNHRTKEFPSWSGESQGAGIMEHSALSLSNQSTRVSISGFLSIFFFQSLNVSMTH